MKKLLTLMLCMLLMTALAGCGGGNDNGATEGTAAAETPATEAPTAQAPAAETISVMIDIDYPDESTVADVDDATINVAAGSSVLDVLNAYADSTGIEILMDTSSGTPYITSINGVAATDSAGWIYEINEQEVMKSADQYTVAAGDKIDWSFENWMDD